MICLIVKATAPLEEQSPIKRGEAAVNSHMFHLPLVTSLVRLETNYLFLGSMVALG